MAEPISKITIVGGGTTGWMAALFFASRFSRELEQGTMTIELIESERIPIVGVGESLAPSMPLTLKELGVDEDAFIRETDASFKIAGFFIDWQKPVDGIQSSWVNPFVAMTGVADLFEKFEIDRPDGSRDGDYGTILSPCRSAIEGALGPKLPGQGQYEHVLRYSYHMDANKCAPYLRTLAEARGVKRVVEDIVDAELDERGHVTALVGEAHGRHPVEFVIDATGFASVLLNRKLGVELVDYSRHLLNDRAVVGQTPHPSETPRMEPATRVTARSHGWTFQIPLRSRMGNGYIYSSNHISDDAVTAEFCAAVGAKEENCRVIRMRVGRPSRNWVGNVVALGLAAGFVEPLESSAIYAAETSLRWLHQYFPDKDFAPALAERYNARATAMYDEIVDYLVMHYVLSDRDDTQYWRDWREAVVRPDSLQANLDLWAHALPVRGDFPATTYFDENTYQAALFGKGFYRGRNVHPERTPDSAEWQRHKHTAERVHTQALATLPDQRTLIDHIRQR